ncbi:MULTISPECIES: Rv1733c family protein [unclassified Saccharothrix]|uniref:Rv1733c family protein n=1 Tax=unclassified Saccharothrix TaxID=2593673 RepID=UPI00307F1A9F
MDLRTAARRVFPGRNPVARRGDRVEGAAVVAAVVVALLGLPVAAAFGSEAHAARAAQVREQQATRHEVPAVLTADAPPVLPAGEGVIAMSSAPARWTAADGSVRSGTVETVPGLPAGATVPIWVDTAGDPADPPLSAEGAVAGAIAVATVVWVLFAAVVGAVCVGLRLARNGINARSWAREWAVVEPLWRSVS